MSDDFGDFIAAVCRDIHFDGDLKKEQLSAISYILEKKNTFCLLPTGFGKSFIFALPALILEKKFPTKEHATLVISPLRGLIRDQVMQWSDKGVRSIAMMSGEDITADQIEDMKNGRYKLIFGTPEYVVENRWRTVWASLANKLAAIAIDEAHCLVTWGNTFRKKYKEIRNLRAILGKIPVLCMTATATDAMIEDIRTTLGVPSFHYIMAVPNRSNVHMRVEAGRAQTEDLDWYVNLLVSEGADCPKALIFCRTIDVVTDTYGRLMRRLEEKGGDDTLVEIFHGHMDKNNEVAIPQDFIPDKSSVRCLISTIAFGLGMQVNNISYIMHWGPPASVLDYFQEIGRCARDGSEGRAIVYIPSNSMRKDRIDKDMIEIVSKSRTHCIRYMALKALKLSTFSDEDIAACCFQVGCCSFCDSQPVS